MHISLIAEIGKHDSPDDIAHHSLLPVVLTPVDIRTAGLASTVDDTSWLEVVKDRFHCWQVLHASGGAEDGLALALEERVQVAANPAIAAGEKKAVV